MKPSPDTKKAAGAVVLAFVIVTCTALVASTARADGPSKADLQNLEDIKRNQEIIEENRPAHERFLEAKGWNEAEIRELNKAGWNVNWQTMQLVPFEAPQAVAPKPAKKAPKVSGVDLDKLADAVAMHETGYCKSPGSPKANARNNCWGIMYWPGGVRTLKTYSSIQEGKEDFKRIWAKHYKRFPDYQLAKTYSGSDKSAAWLANVTHFYETL